MRLWEALAAIAAASAEAEAQTEQDVMVVTGTRTPRLQRDAAVRTDVISGDVLRLSGVRTLADAVSYLPLARSENTCQNCNAAEIQLLGLPGVYNQILFDDLPLLTGVASVYGVEQIPAPLVDQIEVVKGGASVLYGPGAVAGVINVIPRKPRENEFRLFGVHEQRDGRPFSSLGAYGAWAASDGRASISAFGQYDDRASVDLNGDGFTELVDRDLGTGGFLGRFAPIRATEITLTYQFTGEDRRGGDRLEFPSFLARISEDITTRFHRGAITLSHALDDKTEFQALYGVSHVNRDTFYGGLGPVEVDPTSPDFDQDAFDSAVADARNQFGRTEDTLHYLEGRALRRAGAHDLSLGLQYRTETVNDENLSADGEFLGTLVSGSFSTLGVYGQDEWSLTDAIRVIAGLRADFSSEIDDVILNPRIGIWFAPMETLVLRANVSTGFRAPEIFNEDVHIDTLGAEPIRTRNADGLVEERSVSYALGFDFDPQWFGGAVSLDGQAYLTHLEDTFFLGDIQEGPDGGLFQERPNAGRSTVFGAELSATARPTAHLQLIAGGAFVEATFDEPQFRKEEGAVALWAVRVVP